MWTTQPRSNLNGLAAITRGAGRPVLLLHGVGLRAEAWGAQFDLPARIIAPDLPGHGASPWHSGAVSLQGFVQAMHGALETVDTPAIVVGHSMGAMLALELARLAPNRVCAVVALNAVFERSTEAKQAVQSRAAALDGVSIPDHTPTLTRWFGDSASAEREACADWLGSMNPDAYRCAYTAFATSPIPDRSGLAQVTCPALFMTGALEPNSTPEMSKAMAKLAPQGRAIIVDGAAHMMPMTHPAAVNSAIAHLIKEVSG